MTEIWTHPYHDLAICELDWVTDVGGAFADYTLTGRIEGFCYMAITVPNAFPPPANNYDIEIVDEKGVDIFGEALHDRSSSTPEQAVPMIGTATMARRVLVGGSLTLKLSNITNDWAAGKIFLYFEPAKRDL